MESSPYKSSGSSLELEDVTPDVFDAFMMWLYTGFIPHHLVEGGKEVHEWIEASADADKQTYMSCRPQTPQSTHDLLCISSPSLQKVSPSNVPSS